MLIWYPRITIFFHERILMRNWLILILKSMGYGLEDNCRKCYSRLWPDILVIYDREQTKSSSICKGCKPTNAIAAQIETIAMSLWSKKPRLPFSLRSLIRIVGLGKLAIRYRGNPWHSMISGVGSNTRSFQVVQIIYYGKQPYPWKLVREKIRCCASRLLHSLRVL